MKANGRTLEGSVLATSELGLLSSRDPSEGVVSLWRGLGILSSGVSSYATLLTVMKVTMEGNATLSGRLAWTPHVQDRVPLRSISTRGFHQAYGIQFAEAVAVIDFLDQATWTAVSKD